MKKYPSTWAFRQLDELLTVVSGQVDPRIEPFRNMPHIGGENIESHTGKLSGVQTPAELGLQSGKYLFETTDILYSKIRPYLNKVLIPGFSGVCSADIYPLRVDETQVDRNFLVYLLRSNEFLSYAEKHSTRTNIPKINRPALLGFGAYFPPIDEQRHIAAILDRTDAVRRKRQAAIDLTEELLRSTFLEMFGDPVSNPEKWEPCTLDDLLTDIESGWSPKCDSREAEAEEWGVLKLSSVTYGHFNSSENKALLSEDSPRPDLEVKPGDLLFTRKNTYGLVGASAFVHSTRPKLMLSDLIFRLCLKDIVEPVYVWQALSQKSMRYKLSQLAGGTAGSMPNISKTRLRTLSLPVPPRKLQLKYRDVVNNVWNGQNDQKAFLANTNDLFNSLLQRAFRGEL